jgi:integrase
MGKLTALKVKSAPPGRHADTRNLYLLVKPKPDNPREGGARSWVLRVVVNGRRRDFGLGPVDLVSLQEARDKAIEGRKLARIGLDPAAEWKKAAGGIPTFERAARLYHETVKPSWKNGKHGDQWLTTLERHAFPHIGSTRVDHIDAPTIQNVLVPIWLTLPETARRVRQRIGSVLDFAHGKGWRATETPRGAINALMKRLKQPRKGPGFAAMPYADLPSFMEGLRNAQPSIGRLALQFLILTAARSGEVRFATWSELEVDKANWNIPGQRMKAGEPHSVPLTAPALAILDEVRVLVASQNGQLLFPGLDGKPLSDATLAKALRVAGGGDYTVHGFRSSFRDWVAERTSFPGEWAEAALAHALPNKTEAAYRRTKFLDQRRNLMSAWADYLNGASNVLKLVG